MPLLYSGQEVSLKKRLRFFEKDTIDWNGPGRQTVLRTVGDRDVYAFTRIRDGNTVVVAVNFGSTERMVMYEGLTRPGAYRNWSTNEPVQLRDTGSFGIDAHGYRIFVR